MDGGITTRLRRLRSATHVEVGANKVHIRMGPTNNPNEHVLCLDAIIIHNRNGVDSYIRQIKQLRDTLWPLEETEPEQVS